MERFGSPANAVQAMFRGTGIQFHFGMRGAEVADYIRQQTNLHIQPLAWGVLAGSTSSSPAGPCSTSTPETVYGHPAARDGSFFLLFIASGARGCGMQTGRQDSPVRHPRQAARRRRPLRSRLLSKTGHGKDPVDRQARLGPVGRRGNFLQQLFPGLPGVPGSPARVVDGNAQDGGASCKTVLAGWYAHRFRSGPASRLIHQVDLADKRLPWLFCSRSRMGRCSRVCGMTTLIRRDDQQRGIDPADACSMFSMKSGGRVHQRCQFLGRRAG